MFSILQQALPVADWVEGFTEWLTGTFASLAACRTIFDGWNDRDINDDPTIIIDSRFNDRRLFYFQ